MPEKISQNQLTLYAGAGVVSGSNPSQEKTETDWKLKAMLTPLLEKVIFSSFVNQEDRETGQSNHLWGVSRQCPFSIWYP